MEQERRRKRVPTSLPCTIRLQDGDEAPFELVDLSEAGVRIRCNSALTAMTEIRVAMVLPAGRVGREEDVRVDTRGVVVWSHPVEEHFDTGVFFPELDPGTRGALQAFVDSAAR